MKSAKQSSPAVQRNRKPLLLVIDKVFQPGDKVLEVASGTGEHAIFFCQNLLRVEWQPSDVAPDALQSIQAHIEEANVPGCLVPKRLDVLDRSTWPTEKYGGLFNANMIHISVPQTTSALFELSSEVLSPGANLVLYGPFFEEGTEPVASNIEFDRWLKSQNAQWGVRSLDWVTAAAREHGFENTQRIEMPANNLALIFHRSR